MNETDRQSPVTQDNLESVLAGGVTTGWRPRLLRWLAGAGVLLVAVLVYFWLFGGGDTGKTRYVTEPVIVDDLVVTVSATGNLQPTNQVDVGSELSGTVEEVFVDDNDQVNKDQVLARLDRAKLEDAVARARANLGVARAQVLQAEATVAEARANLERLRRVSRLSAGKVPSRSEMSRAEADMKRAEANEASARASVAQAEAALQSDQTSLEKAQIRAPIDGVVLSRQVEPGQTVAASFQAPVLFTLAEDLTKMELRVDVDEADVGKVDVGQSATFSVDAWPSRQYDAVITEVGYGAKTEEGVVSYPATLQVDNSDLSLRPGMTATAEIVTLTRKQALLVPNAALRFVPPAAAGSAEESGGGGLLRALIPRPPHRSRQQPTRAAEGAAHQVWVMRDGEPTAIEISTGASNGRFTEITGGDIQSGTEVVTEAVAARQ